MLFFSWSAYLDSPGGFQGAIPGVRDHGGLGIGDRGQDGSVPSLERSRVKPSRPRSLWQKGTSAGAVAAVHPPVVGLIVHSVADVRNVLVGSNSHEQLVGPRGQIIPDADGSVAVVDD